MFMQLLDMAQQQLDTFDVQGIANTVYVLAVFQHRNQQLLDSLMAAVQYRLDICTPQNLTNIIWAVAMLGYTPEREWMAVYYDAIDARSSRFGPQDVANTLWAYGRLRFEGQQYKVSPGVVNRMLQQAFRRMHEFTPQHLSNSAWGLARLSFAPGEIWGKQFFVSSLVRMESFQARELCSMGWAASRLQLLPDAAWISAYLLACSAYMDKLTAAEISQVS